MTEENYKHGLLGDQAEAFDAIRFFLDTGQGGMFLLDGYAGTGKTYLMNVVIHYVQSNSHRPVLVTAPTHKAVKVIRQHVKEAVDFSTIHSALGLKEHIDGYGKQKFIRDKFAPCNLYDYQFLIVDETSMLADELFSEIEIFVSQGLKVLFVGDSLQIPPVSRPDAIPFDKDLRKHHGIGYTKMEAIIRQKEGNPIIEHSFKIREFIYRPIPVVNRESVTTDKGSILFVPKDSGDMHIYNHILPLFKTEAFKADSDHVKILAWRNKTVDKYNAIIREYIYGQETLARILPGERLIAMEPLVEENRVMIHNSEEMEVLEHTIDEMQISEEIGSLKYYYAKVNVVRDDNPYTEFMVKILHEDSQKLYDEILEWLRQTALSHKQGSGNARMAWIDFFEFKREFFTVRYAYSITCHKSQGSTYDLAVVLESDIDVNRQVYEKNRIFYTACTRPRKDLVVIY